MTKQLILLIICTCICTYANFVLNAFLLFSAIINAVEVHFETPDSGFFLKHSPRQSQSTVAAVTADVVNNPAKPSVIDQSSILSVDRFTIVQTTQPVSIRASYGPFSTKQTVPARFIVPDAMEAQGDHLQVRFQLFKLHCNTNYDKIESIFQF